MAGYFALVRKIIYWCNINDIFVEARGSANGSLVCWLLGITQVDPLKWGTIFERFLSKDRIKPADIDLDVEDIARDRLLDYIKYHFPTEKISTFSKLGVDSEGRGSVLVSYMAGLRRSLGDDFAKEHIGARIKTIEDVGILFPEDYEALKQLSEMEVRKSYGVHAAGIVVSASSQPIARYMPTMLVATSNTTVVQFTVDDVKQLGYTPIDILGQRTLTVMRRTAELLGRKKPIDFSWIPDNDKKTLRSLWEGRQLTGVFHFEGYTKSKGAKLMQPKTTMDLCLAQGLFMPGAMDSGQTDIFLKRRASVVERESVKYIHPAWEAALSQTHGAVIFQEQVIEIMRCLGMSIESINVFFAVVKDSGSGAVGRNEERLESVYKEFERHALAEGIKDPKAAYDSFAGLVNYSFNRAHATGYGIRSYRCAYLKTHFPLEFMTALLESNIGRENEAAYVREARRIGIRILPADVNISGVVYTIDRSNNAIRRGIAAIKGCGGKAAGSISKAAPFINLGDLIARTDSRLVTGGKTYIETGRLEDLNGVLLKLKEAGALQSLGIDRLE
jgi:DNA polymerase-3 subunit alpha